MKKTEFKNLIQELAGEVLAEPFIINKKSQAKLGIFFVNTEWEFNEASLLTLKRLIANHDYMHMFHTG